MTELPINVTISTGVYYAPWSTDVTQAHITFQASAYTYELLAESFFANSLNDGRYLITVSEPVIAFPGITHVVPDYGFWRLFGDVNGDSATANSDFNAFKVCFGGIEFSLDYDGDGSVGNSDFNRFREHFGGSI